MADSSDWAKWFIARLHAEFEAEKTEKWIQPEQPADQAAISDWFARVYNAFKAAAEELSAVIGAEFIAVGPLQTEDPRMAFAFAPTNSKWRYSAECDLQAATLVVKKRLSTDETFPQSHRKWELVTFRGDVWFDHEQRRKLHVPTDVAHFLFEFWILPLAGAAGLSQRGGEGL